MNDSSPGTRTDMDHSFQTYAEKSVGSHGAFSLVDIPVLTSRKALTVECCVVMANLSQNDRLVKGRTTEPFNHSLAPDEVPRWAVYKNHASSAKPLVLNTIPNTHIFKMALKPRGAVLAVTKGIASTVTPSNRNGFDRVEFFRDRRQYFYRETCHDNAGKKRFDRQLEDLRVGYDHKYLYGHIHNHLKSTDLQSALGCHQVGKLKDFVFVRRRNFEHLLSRIESVQGRILPREKQNSELSQSGPSIMLGPESGLDPREPTATALVMLTSFQLRVYPSLTIPPLGYAAGSIIESVQG